MTRLSVIIFVLFVLYQSCNCDVTVIHVPTIGDEYNSLGEYVIFDVNKNKRTQITFEENYDVKNKISSLWLSSNQKEFEPTLFLEYEDLQKSWTLNSTGCEVQESKDSDYPFQSYELTQGIKVHLIYKPRQFLTLNIKDLKDNSDKEEMYRGISALWYDFSYPSKKHGNEMTVRAYWTGDTYTTTSKNKKVPLGFRIKEKTPSGEIHHYINTFLFLHSELDYERFMPKFGRSCPGFEDPEKIPFPDLNNFKSFTFKTEFIWKGNVSYVDTWLDVEQQILRVDYPPYSTIGDGKVPSFSMIMSSEQNAVYTRGPEIPNTVNTISEGRYSPEIIINPKEKPWNAGHFFGVNYNKNQYVRIGKSDVGGLACDVYQTKRNDWPPEQPAGSSVETIWEWCIPRAADKSKVPLPGNAVLSFGLKIYVKKVTSPEVDPLLSVGDLLNYHFFNVKKYDDSDFLTTTAFDISEHFSAGHRQELQFNVPLKQETAKKVDDVVMSYPFDSAWRKAITAAAGLKLSSLRVTNVKTMLLKKGGPMVVYFTLLNRHPSLPEDTLKKELDIDKCYGNLETIVNKSELKIKLFGTNLELKATALSLRLQPILSNITGATSKQGRPLALHAMWAQEKSQKEGLSLGSMAAICGVTLLAGIALGIVAMHKVNLARRKSPMN